MQRAFVKLSAFIEANPLPMAGTLAWDAVIAAVAELATAVLMWEMAPSRMAA